MPGTQAAGVEAAPPLDPSKVPMPPRRPRRSEVAAVTPRAPAAPRTRPATTTPNILDNTSEDASPDAAGAGIVIPTQDGDVTASAGGAEPDVPAALPKAEGQNSRPAPSPLPQAVAPSGSRLVPPDMPLANPPQAPAGPATAPAAQQQAASEGTVVADQPRLKTGGRWTGCTSFKTYNPKTQTYRGKDGLMHECKEN